MTDREEWSVLPGPVSDKGCIWAVLAVVAAFLVTVTLLIASMLV